MTASPDWHVSFATVLILLGAHDRSMTVEVG